MMFSLILATYGRSAEVSVFLQSLALQMPGIASFELIVVDQNDQIDLRPLLAVYESTFPIRHLRSKTRGASLQ